MSVAAAGSSVHPSSDLREWITPQQQFARLCLPLANEVTKVKELIPDIANIVAQYAVDESVTNWYKALSLLKALPEKIPPLPRNIHQIMNEKCPIYGDRVQTDGTYPKIKDTHFLALIPQEFGTLNNLEENILKPYGEEKYLGYENPLRFKYFWDSDRRQHSDVPFAPTHWVLMTNTTLPNSRMRTWDEQVALVDALSQKTFVTYEVPTLQESLTAITIDMVATGEKRYQIRRDPFLHATYTHVQASAYACRLAVGGFAPSGVGVHNAGDSSARHEFVGIAALRKF